MHIKTFEIRLFLFLDLFELEEGVAGTAPSPLTAGVAGVAELFLAGLSFDFTSGFAGVAAFSLLVFSFVFVCI